MRWILLMFLLIAPSLGLGVIFDPYVKLKDIGPMQVSMRDLATGGCWTNIKEVKNYAEDKLEIAGADLSFTGDDIPYAGKKNYFTIAVTAERLSNGLCIGSVNVNIGGYFLTDIVHEAGQIAGLLDFSEYGMRFYHPRNMNNQILDTVKEAIAEWEARD